jgi:hypothetical protein
MATPSTMILRSLRLIGEKTLADTLSSNEQTAYLSDLNTMLESWSLDRLMCYQIVQESRTLTASVGSFTIGSAGTWNTARPTKIVDPCFTRDSGNIDYPLEIISAEAYGTIRQKTSDGSYPSYMFYDSAFVTSLGTIFLYPEPTSGLTLYINSWKQLQTFATISTTVVLPPGYQRAIEFNFAVEVAGGFINVSPEVVKIARESKAAIKGLNIPVGILQLPVGVVSSGRSNILTG